MANSSIKFGMTHALIRRAIPDFLRQNSVLEAMTKELRADERFTYLATTPVGAVTLLVSRSDNTHGKPVVEGWWDERLTSTQVMHLLVGSSREDGKQQSGNEGLLTAQAHAGRLRQTLRATMQTLGASDGVLTRLATYCRTAGVRRLVIVPSGLLGLLPLHAALVPRSSTSGVIEPLVDVVQVSYAPSARIWATSQRHAIKYPAEKINALIVGDPQPQSEGAPPLPGARDEAQAISTLISQAVHGRVSTFTGEAATLSEVLDVLRGQGATLTHVHFACHGLAELTNPQTSGVLLAYEARLMTRDLLDPVVVRFAQLRLAILSACRTALVGTELPDEVVGLPSAWLQAGAKSVLASLWPISDSKTVALMTKFYELHLLDRCEPVDALWLAQRWLRGLPTWREDCRAAGAAQAAEGPEVGNVIHRLALARGEITLLDDLEDSEESIETMERNVVDRIIGGTSQGNEVSQVPTIASKHQFWENARHWAAFVMYGT